MGSRECSTGLLDRLPGATLFPERPIGAAIVGSLHRPGGSVICVAAPAMADAEEQIDYFVRLGMSSANLTDVELARDRVSVLSIEDRSSRWLSEKLMDPDNPEAKAVCQRLLAAVEVERRAGREVLLNHVEPSEPLERLCDQLGIVGDQAPSWAIPLGTKSASREIFQAHGIPHPPGTPVVRDIPALGAAMVPLVQAGHRKFVIKLDSTAYGAGLGNALVDVDEHAAADDLPAAIVACIRRATVTDTKWGWSGFSEDIPRSGVFAEVWVTGDEVTSPSVQGQLSPGGPRIVSTHEQVLAPNLQTFTGSLFPAEERYRASLMEYGRRVGLALWEQGVHRGDYGVDFIAVRRAGRWEMFACEVNIRATGTRHGYDMATILLGTEPDADGELRVDGERRVYLASDGIMSEQYVGLRPRALIDAVERSPLHYDPSRKQGVVLHMLSPVVEFGKFGAVCVATSLEAARRTMDELRALTLRVSEKHPIG